MTTGVTFGRVIHSEGVKLLGLRSTVAGYALIWAGMVALCGACLTLPVATDGTGENAALTALLLVELLVGSTCVLAATGEYSARTARSTFTAVPRRLTVLLAKIVLHAGVVVALLLSAAVVARVAAGLVAPASIGGLADPAVLRSVLGSCLSLAMVAGMGVGAGVLTRSAAAGIGVVAVLTVLPAVVVTAPEVTAYLPGRAVMGLVLPDPFPGAALLSPVAAGVVLTAWAVAVATAGGIALRRRDV